MNTLITFRVIFLSVLISLALGPVCLRLANRLSLSDVPGSAPHKRHGKVVPIAGGIVLFGTILALSLIEGVYRDPSILAILASATIVFVFGLIDDYKRMAPVLKLMGQLLATFVLIRMGVYVRIFGIPWLDYSLTVVWMVGITNAYNFVDSMDGLAMGLAGMAAAFFIFVTIESQQSSLSLFSTILLGACLGSYYYNITPAYYFIGDSGSQYIGFSLAALAIAYNPLGFSPLASWYVPILLAGVPIFDTTLVVLSRIRRGEAIYKGALDHTYHRLVALGMSNSRAVATMHIAALLLGCLAFIALNLSPLYANLIFAGAVLIGAICILLLERGYKPEAMGYVLEETLTTVHGTAVQGTAVQGTEEVHRM